MAKMTIIAINIFTTCKRSQYCLQMNLNVNANRQIYAQKYHYGTRKSQLKSNRAFVLKFVDAFASFSFWISNGQLVANKFYCKLMNKIRSTISCTVTQNANFKWLACVCVLVCKCGVTFWKFVFSFRSSNSK